MEKRMFFIFIGLMAMVMLDSCAKEEIEEIPGPDPVFYIKQEVFEIGAAGGEGRVGFSLKNPEKDVLPVPSEDCEWISGLEVSLADSTISFVVDITDIEEVREAIIEVAYGDAEQSFTVRQAGNDPAFTLELVDTKVVSFIQKTVPKDPEMKYFINVIEKNVMDGIASDEELLEYDRQYFQQLADVSGITVEQVLGRLLRNGEETRQANNLKPSTDYVWYVYGLNEKAEPLTKVYKKEVVTGAFDFNNDCDFDITVTVDVLDVLTHVKPSDPEQLYYYGATIGDETDEEMLIRAQAYIDAYTFAVMYGPNGNTAPIEDIVRSILPSGEQSFPATYDEQEKDGRVMIYAVDAQGHVVSEAHTEEFRTGTVSLSDNEISIEVPVIEVRSASFVVTATNDDPYVVFFDETAAWQGLSDAEIIEKALETADLSEGSGLSSGKMKNLIRNTDYSVFAFGYEGGQVTTGLSRCDFTTLDAIVSDVTCELPVEKYFNGDDVAAAYPDLDWTAGMAVIPVEPVVSDGAVKYYYHIWDAAWADKEAYHDDLIISWLLAGGMSQSQMTFYTAFDEPRCVIAVAVDADGNFGPVYRQAITFTKEGCSPVDEFVPFSVSEAEYIVR